MLRLKTRGARYLHDYHTTLLWLMSDESWTLALLSECPPHTWLQSLGELASPDISDKPEVFSCKMQGKAILVCHKLILKYHSGKYSPCLAVGTVSVFKENHVIQLVEIISNLFFRRTSTLQFRTRYTWYIGFMGNRCSPGTPDGMNRSDWKILK